MLKKYYEDENFIETYKKFIETTRSFSSFQDIYCLDKNNWQKHTI